MQSYSEMNSLKNNHSLKRTPSRFFNEIIYDGDTVTKSIFNREKGLAEIFFYENIPDNFKKFFPRLKNTKIDEDKIQYSMELINQQDLSILFIQNEIDTTFLKYIFRKIDDYHCESPKLVVEHSKYQDVFSELTSVKLENRWKIYSKLNIYKDIRAYFQQSEGTNIDDIKNEVAMQLTDNIAQLQNSQLILSHGDMCFSNMFIEPFGELKLVDPRGAQKYESLFLPLHYDLAKLSQCINGNYDGILNSIEISFENQANVFSDWLKSKDIDLSFIRLIEASLFLSLMPLHKQDLCKHIQFIKAAQSALKASYTA